MKEWQRMCKCGREGERVSRRDCTYPRKTDMPAHLLRCLKWRMLAFIFPGPFVTTKFLSESSTMSIMFFLSMTDYRPVSDQCFPTRIFYFSLSRYIESCRSIYALYTLQVHTFILGVYSKCLHAFMFKYIIFIIQPIAAEPVFILRLKGLFKFWLVTALTGLSKHLPTMRTHHRLCWRHGWILWLYSYDVTTWSYKRHSLGMLALYIQCFPHNSFWGWWVISRLTLNRKGCITISTFPGGM